MIFWGEQTDIIVDQHFIQGGLYVLLSSCPAIHQTDPRRSIHELSEDGRKCLCQHMMFCIVCQKYHVI